MTFKPVKSCIVSHRIVYKLTLLLESDYITDLLYLCVLYFGEVLSDEFYVFEICGVVYSKVPALKNVNYHKRRQL